MTISLQLLIKFFSFSLLLLLALTAPLAFGEDEPRGTEASSSEVSLHVEEPPTGDLSFWQRSADWLIGYRDNISAGIESMAIGVDRFFAGNAALEDENKSFVRVRAGTEFSEGDGFGSIWDYKIRLSLPATQKKYRLVIENAAEDDESLEEKNRPSTVSEDTKEQTQCSAALQYVSREADRWDTKAELGIRATIPPDPFLRHTAKRRWDLEGPWSMRFRQELAYYSGSGYRANEELKFERRISENWFFRAKTEVQWREKVDSMHAAQVFNLIHRLDDKRGINYQAGIIAKSLHHTVIDNVYLAINYRQLLYKDWLYLNIIPEIAFPKEDDYNSTSSIAARFEILFFE